MKPFIETRELKKYYKVGKGTLHAVDGVNLQIEKGRTLGIVGESGCGKTTLGRTMLGLVPATSGSVRIGDIEVTKLKKHERRLLRREAQIIFQDPHASINPRHSISRIIGEPMRVNGMVKGKKEQEARVREIMELVGLAPRLYDAYPHELDGGRRQRVGIARALGLNPRFIVCDEPVSALDVSIQAQILNLLMDLQDEMALTYLFITHDLSVVKYISDDIAVMYLGTCVEKAPASVLFHDPRHPYTHALLPAIPVPSAEARRKKAEMIRGEISSPIDPVPGCRFAPRCPHAGPACQGQDIPLREVSPGHFVACVL